MSVDAVRAATAGAPVVVIARGETAVRELLGGAATCVEQDAALGTGDALRSVPSRLRSAGPVLVSHGDAPLIRPETLRRLLAAHASSPAGMHAARGNSRRSDRAGPGHPRRGRPRAPHRRGGRPARRANRYHWSATRASTSSKERSSGRPSTASTPPTPRASTTSPTWSRSSPARSRRWSPPIPTRSWGSTTAASWRPPRRCSAAARSTR